jgi:uncharacterized OB-fold protein
MFPTDWTVGSQEEEQVTTLKPAPKVEGPSVPGPRPRANELTGPYWRLGATGSLHLLQCAACGFLNHPPSPVCRRCRGRSLAWQPTSGTGRLFGFGVNEIDWGRDLPRFPVVIVDLDDQPGLRLFSRLVDWDDGDLRVGLPVEVRFERLPAHATDADAGPIHLPVFAPRRGAG